MFAHVHDAISREKGFIAVEARTTVELDQSESCVGCVLIDVDELSESLRSRASNPILLAYKYLLPEYQLKLSVKKHGDVDVLIAAVDCAYFTATKVEEGRVMYKLIMKVMPFVSLMQCVAEFFVPGAQHAEAVCTH